MVSSQETSSLHGWEAMMKTGNLLLLLWLVALSSSCKTAKDNSARSDVLVLSPQEKAAIKQYQVLSAQVRALCNGKDADWVAFEKGVREKLRDYPELAKREDILGCAYVDFETLIWHYMNRDPAKALALAQEVVASPAPEHFRQRAAGFLWRTNAVGMSVEFRFSAWDGREVDSHELKGKVVLIDFWESGCPGCADQAPVLGAIYKRFHDNGLEVVGSCADWNQKNMARFIQSKKILWPTDFEGNPAVSNKLQYQFGIYGYPSLVLLDKKGRVRDLNASSDADRPEPIEHGLATKIAKLLDE